MGTQQDIKNRLSIAKRHFGQPSFMITQQPTMASTMAHPDPTRHKAIYHKLPSPECHRNPPRQPTNPPR